MARMLVLFISLLLSTQLWADDTGRILTHCKEQWPGMKQYQQYCYTANKNYRDWLKEIRKRSFSSNQELVAKVDRCIRSHHPDYHKAFDCVSRNY